MAFHVACPITCKRICFCTLGFPRTLQPARARNGFLQDVDSVEEFLKDPWGRIRVSKEDSTVQVAVPQVAPAPSPTVVVDVGGDAAAEEAAALSAQTKRVALQRKAAAAMVAAEDYARRFESGDIAIVEVTVKSLNRTVLYMDINGRIPRQSKFTMHHLDRIVPCEVVLLKIFLNTNRLPINSLADLQVSAKDLAGEEQGGSGVNVMCRLCFGGENEGSERARRMLSCKTCGKKYHRNCLKNWAQNRDLFHWSSWKCPSCRICEICRRTGDPNKFMFCRRCDGAYHCYCQHPPHKNVSSGPYLCPKHTRCHSCGSNVPGNGLSVRWFLGYTCCDACGRLFVKGNYCPVCLKVYRDSESTPMVCCDVCQRWVHCLCDGISDEKYLQFQVDGNLQYKCPTCRGECYQVRDLEDAVRELWRRKDLADRDLIASLRAAAGLPTEDEIFSISPYSDDEENGPVMLKNEYGRPLRLSLKGLVDKSPKKAKEHGKKLSSKKHSKKKGYQVPSINKTEHRSYGGHHDIQSHGHSLVDDMQSPRSEGPDVSSSVAGVVGRTEAVVSVDKPGKQKFVDEVMVNDEGKMSRIKFKNNKSHDLDSGEDTGPRASKSNTGKAKKLVINLGARKINVSNSPRSDSSSCQKEQDLVTSNGAEDSSLQKVNNKFELDRHDGSAKSGDEDRADHGHSRSLKIAGRDRNVIKLGKVRQDVSDLNTKFGRGNSTDRAESVRQKSIDGSRATFGTLSEVATSRGDNVYVRKRLEGRSNASGESNDTPVVHSFQKDSKPSLKLKFRKPSAENQNFLIPQLEEEKSSIKGQRSKRKRPSPIIEKKMFNEGEDGTQSKQDSLMDEMMDAHWILKKLGKDAIGKRVEIQQQSDNTWHKGVVSDAIEGTSMLSVSLDDGRVKTLELGKQGVRFVPQKQKRSVT